MDGDPTKPTPRIVNLRSGLALLAGVALILIANSDIIFSTDDTDVLRQKSLFLLLLKEIGFALIVALTIWGMWEYFAQAETDDHWNARIERVAKSVFFGVFKRNFPQELMQEANLLLLEQNFVRTGCQMLYTLTDDTFTNQNGEQTPFVRLEAVARFKVRNIGNAPIPLPIGTSLPNPVHPDLKTKCGVRRVQWRTGGDWSPFPLNEAEAKFREQLADDNIHQAAFTLSPITLNPNDEVEIVWDYVMAKESEDSEVMTSLLPTESISITIVDRGPTLRKVRARSIHRVPLEKITSDQPTGTYSFRLDRYLLPKQGFVMWWKRDFGTGNGGAAPELTEPTTPSGD